jgi:hypothetical protein
MSQRRGRSLDRSRGTGYKPELLVQYDKQDVAFTAWLASVEKIVYAGDQCYVLHFNLHFMNGLSERKRFRGAKFEVEVHSSSGIEAPEMMFVRPVSSSVSRNKLESSSSRGNNKRATSAQRRRQKHLHYRRPRSLSIGNSATEVRLVQGMVLPPNIARWKICEPPESKDGIPQYVKLQAMVRCRGGFAIEVKDFQVKVGYKDWLWPNRLLRASHRSRDLESASLLDDGIATDTGDRNYFASIARSSETVQSQCQTVPGSPSLPKSLPRKLAGQSADCDSILLPRPNSVDSESPQISVETDAGSDRSLHRAYSIFSSFQAWLDSSRNFDKPQKLKLQALQEFMSVTSSGQRASSQPGARASVISDQSQRYVNKNSNRTEMNVLVGELNSESDLLEAWLRRESLRKKAIETCLDTASWDASSHTRLRASPPNHHESGPQIRPQNPYEVMKQRRCETAENFERPCKVTVPMRSDMVLEKRQSDMRTAGTVPPPRGSKPETSMDPLEGEGPRGVWTIHDGIHEVIAAKPSKELGVKRSRARVASPTDTDRRWSPTLAWKELSPAYHVHVSHVRTGYAF